jgi:hypothetical protein
MKLCKTKKDYTMKNSLLILGSFAFLSFMVACGNNNNSNEERGHAFDSSDVMYDDGQSIYDTTGRDSIGMDTLSTDSLIPPTPMN